MKYVLESGKELELSVVDVKTAMELLRATKTKIGNGADIVDVCLDPSVLPLLLNCGKKAFYDGKRVDALDVFDENRTDMLDVLTRILADNINPFSTTPLIQLKATAEK